ncbi:gas vesicle protein GvpO [Pseudonocardia sichuanensis]
MADEAQVADGEQEQPRRPRRARPAAKGSDGSVPAAVAARRAAEQVADFTGRSPECVISIDRADGGWKVGVEVVESRRIPDTQDVLAIYEVSVDRRGELVSYRRTRRYARGQLDERCR